MLGENRTRQAGFGGQLPNPSASTWYVRQESNPLDLLRRQFSLPERGRVAHGAGFEPAVTPLTAEWIADLPTRVKSDEELPNSRTESSDLVSDLLALTRLVSMERMIIELTEEETWSWRKGDRASEELKKEVCAMARLCSQRLMLTVEIQTLPEHNPDYCDDRPTVLWSSNQR